MNYIDYILNFYNKNHVHQTQTKINFDTFTIFNPNSGIGDALSTYLLDQPIPNKQIKVIIKHPTILKELDHFNSYIKQITGFDSYHTLISVWDIQLHSTFGGHFIQKIQQFINLPVDIIPKPKLSAYNIPIIKNKVVMTFDKGIVDQTHIHPRARQIYDESKHIIQKFINDHKNIYNFVEVGKFSLGLDNVDDKTNIGITKTAEEIASCDYFFGNHNGLMHIAAALNKKSIIIINFPDAKDLVLPCLKKTNIADIDWLYPQNIHLHQDNDSLLVPKLSYNNIKRAFNHEIYPFFSDKYLFDTFPGLIL